MKNPILYHRIIIAVLIVGCFFSYWWCCYLKTSVTTIILIRHADRPGNEDQIDPVLGAQRAAELARVLGNANVSAIYTSTANRTQQTAQPLATQLGITPETYSIANLDVDLPALVDEIKTQHRGKVVLVVGHSNTVPQTINHLGYGPALSDIPHAEYDNMYILTLSKKTSARLVKLKYGAHTP